MSTTNTDAVSIIVTLLGCGLAIYGIVSEPLVVDSTRPTQTGEAGQVPAEVPAYARLWESVAVVWLPDAHLWEETPLATIQSIYAAFPRPKANLDQDRWVLLGPSDSDSFAYFKSRLQENSSPPDVKPAVSQISNPGGYPRKLWLIPFRASVSESILRFLGQEGSPPPSRSAVSPVASQETGAKAHWSFPELGQTDVIPIRMPIRDDILCAALIREIAERGSLPPHTNTINVTVFAEWDTLDGRALAAALRCRAAVRGEYKKQQVDAARLETRLKSYLTDAGPLQDNECSLIVELKQFLEWNTTILPEQSLALLDKAALSRSGFRERLCDYLEQNNQAKRRDHRSTRRNPLGNARSNCYKSDCQRANDSGWRCGRPHADSMVDNGGQVES